jgi:hypothetical protein
LPEADPRKFVEHAFADFVDPPPEIVGEAHAEADLKLNVNATGKRSAQPPRSGRGRRSKHA